MVAIPLSHGLGDRTYLSALAASALWCFFASVGGLSRRRCTQLVQPGRECSLDLVGVRCPELVFKWQDPMRPGGKGLRFADLRELRDELLLKSFRVFWRQGWGFW